MLRETIKTETIAAMKAGDKARTATLRLIGAKIKDRDIELRPIIAGGGKAPDNDDDLVVDVLRKMAKQRRESIALYEQGGRAELAAQEQSELVVIEEFLPQTMSDEQTTAAILAIKAEIGAESVKDMGKVMAELKARHGAQLDMSKASGLVKAALS